jgi:hypothetical protein
MAGVRGLAGVVVGSGASTRALRALRRDLLPALARSRSGRTQRSNVKKVTGDASPPSAR